MRVLVIEDESAVREILQRGLMARGCEVTVAPDGEEGLRIGMERALDVAIVDLGLPGMGGVEVIRRWRRSNRGIPVLVLSARLAWPQKIEALDAGADDYMTKPFHFEEVVARLEAILRRVEWGRNALQMRAGSVVLDDTRQRVTVGGRVVRLSTLEHRALRCLMTHPGELVSKAQLARYIYARDCEPAEELKLTTLKVYIAQLRRKLDPDNRLNPIEAVRGGGYRFVLPRESEKGSA